MSEPNLSHVFALETAFIFSDKTLMKSPGLNAPIHEAPNEMGACWEIDDSENDAGSRIITEKGKELIDTDRYIDGLTYPLLLHPRHDADFRRGLQA